MAEILDKTFLDLNGLKTYDGKLKNISMILQIVQVQN